MSVSNRYREISQDVSDFYQQLSDKDLSSSQGVRNVNKASAELAKWDEQVGEIPRMSLEFKLTPVLLKAHNNLDRARLLFEESGLEEQASATWDLQQKIYRLLNDL